MLGFEFLTLAPIDHRLIQRDLLDQKEINWLNQYHRQVYQKLEAGLPKEVAIWLRKVTEKI